MNIDIQTRSTDTRPDRSVEISVLWEFPVYTVLSLLAGVLMYGKSYTYTHCFDELCLVSFEILFCGRSMCNMFLRIALLVLGNRHSYNFPNNDDVIK